MTLLPDIVRESTIISGKQNTTNLQPSTNNNNSSPIAQHTHSATGSAPSITNNQLKTTSVSYSAPTQNHFPNLIYNDKKRSTSYQRSSSNIDDDDKKNLITSPIATNYIYNWPSPQRIKSNMVRAKSRVYKPLSRIYETSRPPPPYKLNTSWETVEAHFHNEKRTLDMKRWQYLKEHTTWSIYPYATIDEREVYNKQIRETLKEQMEQKLKTNHRDFVDKCQESKIILEKDRGDIESDKNKKIEKSKFLNHYSLNNKKLMEEKWTSEYLLKRDTWIKENQLLGDNPINWSKTLK